MDPWDSYNSHVLIKGHSVIFPEIGDIVSAADQKRYLMPTSGKGMAHSKKKSVMGHLEAKIQIEYC
jgi:hypothetical protein